MSDPTVPQGDFPTVSQVLASAETLPLQGIDLLSRIRGFARAQIGRHEEGGDEHRNGLHDQYTDLIGKERTTRRQARAYGAPPAFR